MRAERNRQKPQKQKKKSRSGRLLRLNLLLAAGIVVLVAGSYLSTRASLSVTLPEEPPVVEFGASCPSSDYILNAKGIIAPESENLDTGTLGTQEFRYTVYQPLYGGLLRPSRTFTLQYEVVDTVPPAVLWSGDGTVLERGTDFDLNSILSYGDNADPSPSIEVDGEVDMDTAGEYPLHVTATDSSGNQTSWDLTVTVADSLPDVGDSAERTDFEDFAAEYAGEGRSFGIDVSEWQDEVDFEAVREAGCEFAVLRIGYSSDGKITADSTFEQNLQKAQAAGLPIGLYFYSTDRSEAEARASADWILEKLNGFRPDLPVVFDWEDFGQFQNYGINFEDLNRFYDAFAAELAAGGCDCMLYSSRNRLGTVWKIPESRPLWLAHYTEETDYEGPFRMWQARCTGRIDGIEGAVDLDILYS